MTDFLATHWPLILAGLAVCSILVGMLIGWLFGDSGLRVTVTKEYDDAEPTKRRD